MVSHELLSPPVQPDPAWVRERLDHPVIREQVVELLRRYPQPMAALLPVLWVAQARLGWLPHEAVAWAAETCGTSAVHAWGVATFYTMYRKRPIGRFHLQICQNVSCHIQGAEEVIAHAEGALGVDSHGGTTPDGLFTLDRVECLGACGNGPVMQLGDLFVTDLVNGTPGMPVGCGLTPERFDRILTWCREEARQISEAPEPDPLAGTCLHSAGHPGAPGATAIAQVTDYAPLPPVLGPRAQMVDGVTVVTWRAAPETVSVQLERRTPDGAFERLFRIGAREVEARSVDLSSGDVLRLVGELADGRICPPSVIFSVPFPESAA